jgi:hypothetical protein
MAYNQGAGRSPAPRAAPTPWYWWLAMTSAAILGIGVILHIVTRLRRPS